MLSAKIACINYAQRGELNHRRLATPTATADRQAPTVLGSNNIDIPMRSIWPLRRENRVFPIIVSSEVNRQRSERQNILRASLPAVDVFYGVKRREIANSALHSFPEYFRGSFCQISLFFRGSPIFAYFNI